MSQNTFGILLKKHRIHQGITLREYCHQHLFDPGNYSRLERGITPPPRRGKLEEYAIALGLKRGSQDWFELLDSAAASRGEFPNDLASNEILLGKLPVLFRALRYGNLDNLIQKIVRG